MLETNYYPGKLLFPCCFLSGAAYFISRLLHYVLELECVRYYGVVVMRAYYVFIDNNLRIEVKRQTSTIFKILGGITITKWSKVNLSIPDTVQIRWL